MEVTRFMSRIARFRVPLLYRSIHNSPSRWPTPYLPRKHAFHRLPFPQRALSCCELTSANFQFTSHGEYLIMKNGGKEVSYHPTWLRQNCQCPSCMASSGQKKIDPTDLSPSLTIKSASPSGDRLVLVWSSGHHGYIELDWLKRTPSSATQSKEDSSDPRTATELPVLNAAGLLEDKEKYWRWLHCLNEYGVCLLTDLGVEERYVVKLSQAMYNVQHTVYGEIFDIEAKEDFINIAYSTECLGFHMDLVYHESPPGLQLLHCLRFDKCVKGGESVMLDMFAVVEELHDKWPEHFNTLTRVPATFQQVHYKRDEPMDIVYQCPHIQVDCKGKVVAMTWAPPVEGPLRVPKEDLQPYYEAYHCLAKMLEDSKLKMYHRLRPGEVMTFNNRRVLHSRNAFTLNGGQRHLQGAYVNIDHFKSAYQVLHRQLGKTVPVRRVFNKNST